MPNQAPELWDTAEIAAYLRQNRKSVQNRLIHKRDFPEPLRGTGRPKLWVKSEVINYFLDRPKNKGGSRNRPRSR